VTEPILLMTCPRSGSSMTAGLFHVHGVWAGTCRPGDEWNPKGHFENLPVKNLIKKQWHRSIVNKGVLAKRLPGFREAVETAIRGDGYDGGKWLWKGSALYWPAFFEFDPTWITVRRNRESTVRSCIRSGMLDSRRTGETIDIHHRVMDELNARGAVEVRTDELVAGEYSSLERALDRCGIEMDREKVRQWIDPGAWHYVAADDPGASEGGPAPA